MFKAFLAVLGELVEFVFSGFKVPRSQVLLSEKSTQREMPPSASSELELVADSGENISYIVVQKVDCHSRPVVAFDTRMATFSYGEEVVVLAEEGKFVQVKSKDGLGWIEKSAVTDKREDVFPNFLHQTFYFSDTTETERLRKYIHDECSGGELHVPLQSVEYILYMLNIHNITPTWSGVRPRTPGLWQKILRGETNIHISIEPKKYSVMEYVDESQIGRLAFVEKVGKNGAVEITSVGLHLEGEYRRDILTSSEWREFRPVFISFL